MRLVHRWSLPGVLFWLAVGGLAVADNTDIQKLIEKVQPAYVFVGGGSGAIISPDGYVITNAHVAGSSRRWKVRTADGTYYNARMMGQSPHTDLALLKIDHADDLPYLPMADSDQVTVGDVVIAIGNPFALGNIDGKPTVTLGVVSALHVDRPRAYDAIQTDTPINPGNSGGPLINMKGELVGVNAQIQTRFGLRQNTGIGYSISANQVKRFLPSLKEADGRHVPTGRLKGITIDTHPDKKAVVLEVEKDSDADKAGVKQGDHIASIGKAPIENIRDFLAALGRYPIGVEVPLTLQRTRQGAEEPELVATKMEIVKRGRAYIGFNFNPRSRSSCKIHSVDAGSPAAKAGVKPGDILVGIGRAAIRSRFIYYRHYRQIEPGASLPFTFRRGKGILRTNIVIGEVD